VLFRSLPRGSCIRPERMDSPRRLRCHSVYNFHYIEVEHVNLGVVRDMQKTLIKRRFSLFELIIISL